MVDVEGRIDAAAARRQHVGSDAELVDVRLSVAGAMDRDVWPRGRREDIGVVLHVPGIDLDRLRGVDGIVRASRLVQLGGAEVGDELGQRDDSDIGCCQRPAAAGNQLGGQRVCHRLQRVRTVRCRGVAVIRAIQPDGPDFAAAHRAAEGNGRIAPGGGTGDLRVAADHLGDKAAALRDRDPGTGCRVGDRVAGAQLRRERHLQAGSDLGEAVARDCGIRDVGAFHSQRPDAACQDRPAQTDVGLGPDLGTAYGSLARRYSQGGRTLGNRKLQRHGIGGGGDLQRTARSGRAGDFAAAQEDQVGGLGDAGVASRLRHEDARRILVSNGDIHRR